MLLQQPDKVGCYFIRQKSNFSPRPSTPSSKYGNPHGVGFFHSFGQHFKDPNCVTEAEKADLSRQCKFSSLKLFSLKRHGAKLHFALY